MELGKRGSHRDVNQREDGEQIALESRASEEADQDHMGRDEAPNNFPWARGIETIAPPCEQDREGAHPAEIIDEQIVEAAQQRQGCANRVERVPGIVLREARIAE